MTDTRRLNGMNYLRNLISSDWSGGFIVGATTSKQVVMKRQNWKLGKHNDRSRIESDDLHTLLGDEGFQEVWHPFIPVELSNLNDDELGIKFWDLRFQLFIQKL